MHPYFHAASSVQKHGGRPDDYLALHAWFDEFKAQFCNFRHRAMRHHAAGIFEAERIFGPVIRNADGKLVPTRILGEQHVREDCGRVPTLADWLSKIRGERWMIGSRALIGGLETEGPRTVRGTLDYDR